MVVHDVSRERLSKTVTILIGFIALTVAGLWYSRQQGYTLIIEISYILALFLAFAIIYDRTVIR